MTFKLIRHTGVQKIVKYFRERDLPNYRRGSFKFGTLKEYRTYEGEVQRLSDREEGLYVRVAEGTPIPGKPGIFKLPDLNINGMKFFDNTVGPYIGGEPDRPRGIAVHQEVNAHVLCFTKGSYSRDHHRLMMEGGRLDYDHYYEGDPELTMAAEIDLVKFFRAIGRSCSKSKRILGLPVIYGERREVVSPSELQENLLPANMQDFVLRSIFTKKVEFSAENEYRVFLYEDGMSFLPNDAAPFIVQDRRLMESILHIKKIG